MATAQFDHQIQNLADASEAEYREARRLADIPRNETLLVACGSTWRFAWWDGKHWRDSQRRLVECDRYFRERQWHSLELELNDEH